MNPYVILELARQRTAERNEAARRASLVKEVRKALRQRARDEALVLKPIPDYVDGTFRRPGDPAPTEHVGAGR
jgi:hypothetical protein